jgi:acyl-CoA reductase-like NAD-dependent aldehyde dehydrogenase
MEDAGLPKDVLQIVTGSGSELGPHLIDNSDYIMFTGSTATGRSVAERAGRNLIGASMELGGKNAMIVLEDADLDKAVEGAERALFPTPASCASRSSGSSSTRRSPTSSPTSSSGA